jgi:hypothetical protein
VIGGLLLVGLVGLVAPAAADQGTFGCTVLAGTEGGAPAGGPIGVSSTGTGPGMGECEMHTLEKRSRTTQIDVPDGCQIHADTDVDLFVEERVGENKVYTSGTSMIAFCEAGIVMADNRVSLVDI